MISERMRAGAFAPALLIIMEDKKLPPRLEAIAEWVPNGAKLADVGTDHALLPLWLLKKGRILSAVATDINEQPLKRAERNAEKAEEDRIRFVLCDGLAAVDPAEADTVVIAGLGGENIAEILRRSPWSCREGMTLILQPMSRTEVLCRSFFELGLRLRREQLVEDAGRVYPIFELTHGEMEPWKNGEYYTGPFTMLEQSPLLHRFLSEQQRRLRSAVDGLAHSGRDNERMMSLSSSLEDIDTALNKIWKRKTI